MALDDLLGNRTAPNLPLGESRTVELEYNLTHLTQIPSSKSPKSYLDQLARGTRYDKSVSALAEYSGKRTLMTAVGALALVGAGCLVNRPEAKADPGRPGAPVSYTYQVVQTYHHDPQAFTQGLIYLDGMLYEGTGLNGRSTVRKVRLETGEVLQKLDLPQVYFGEGITNWGPRLVQLTWQSGVGFVYDRSSFQQVRSFSYDTEGWGLTQDGTSLIESDGSATLRFWNPETFAEVKRITVHDGEKPVTNLNELEYIRGEIFANIWQTDLIARISPQTGAVTGWINLEGLLTPQERAGGVDVLNGIAYDAAADRLFVTGKLWPKLFQIKLQPNSHPLRRDR